jgi:hypothetical protein
VFRARDPGRATPPELSVVVLSYRNEATILSAVESLLGQDEPLEVVVSHSGGGPTPSMLSGRWPGVRVVSSVRRRLPGAARNAGVAASRAPFVAFLAADCRAASGWASARMAHHRAGAAAVGSAVTPVEPCPAAIASHLLQHRARRPGVVAPEHLRLGVSYAREVLDRHGPFPDLEVAEDAVLNARLLEAGVEIVWAPDVVTEHAYPTAVGALLADQRRRGRMAGALGPRLLARARVVGAALGDAPASLAALPAARPAPGRRLRAAPLVVAGAVAKSVGALSGGPASPGALAEVELRRRRAVERRDARRDTAGQLGARSPAPLGEGEAS